MRHFEVFSEFEKRQKVLFGVFGPNITKVLANEKRLNYHLATLIPVILQDSPITSRIQNNLKSCPGFYFIILLLIINFKYWQSEFGDYVDERY